MVTCLDCNTVLKQLFGRHMYCPNDCDKKESEYEISWLPMWEAPHNFKALLLKPNQHFFFYPSKDSVPAWVSQDTPIYQFKVYRGNYKQEMFNMGRELIKIVNLSSTEDLLLTKEE